MTALRLVAATVALWLSAGCSGSNEPGPMQPSRTLAIPWNAHALTGHGDVLAFEYTDTSNAGSFSGFRSTLQVYRRDMAPPHDLLDLGTVYLGVDTLYHRLSDLVLTEDWAIATLNFNDGASGWVAVVSLVGPTPALVATLALTPTLDHAVASGRWLLVSAGNEISLIDLEAVSFPIVKVFDIGTLATCLVPVSGGFLVFTNAGYGRVVADPVAPTYAPTADAALRAFRKAHVYGTRAHVAGPSPFAGKTRVARIDVGNPDAPSVEASVDVDGSLGLFAYDGAGTYVLSFPTWLMWERTPARTVWIADGAGLSVAGERSVAGLMPSDVDNLHLRGGTMYALTPGGIGLYAPP